MEKSYNLRIGQEFCQPQIGRKVRIFTHLFARRKKHNIHTDMQYIIKNVIYRLKRRKL